MKTITPILKPGARRAALLCWLMVSLIATLQPALAIIPQNTPPTISDIPDQTIETSTSTGAIPFSITDKETAASSLRLTGSSSDQRVISANGISFAGEGNSRTVTITPISGATGKSTITVSVIDGGNLSAIDTFVVTVVTPNASPTIDRVGDISVLEDAATQTVQLTGIGAGSANEKQTLTVTATSSNPSMVPNPTVIYTSANPTGALTFKPVAHAVGSVTITVTVNDGAATHASTSVGFVVTVTPVNDPPSFKSGGDQTVLEDSSAATVSGWASGLNSGPSDEGNQTLTFIVSNNNNALFAVQPSISASGALSFTPAGGVNGSATATVQVRDSGGTANGGSDTSASQTFNITVTPVNDAPSFRKGADQTVAEDSGPQTVAGWALSISPGASDEANQVVNFIVSNNNNALFSTQPAINSAGALSFTPAANANGSATITVQVHDNGGTANGGSDTSAAQTFAITVTPVNDAPAIDAILDVTVNEDSGTKTVNLTGIGSGAANEQQTLTVTAISRNTALVPDPTINYTSPAATGVLSFTPIVNASGTAVIVVTVTDGGTVNPIATRSFTVTVNAANDGPSFRAGPSQTVNEDAGPQTVAGWATGMTPGGPPDEANQAVDFLVSNNNNTLFSAQPAIAPNGTLTFTPAGNANGNATVTVQLHDNGGTANGGSDTSASQSFVITVTPVNDAPTINPIADVTISEDASSQTVTLSNLGPGSSNEKESITITATSGNPGLIPNPIVTYTNPNTTGSLAFTPTVNATGSAVITVTVNDGQTVNSSTTRNFTVTVTPVNDAPSFRKGGDQTVAEDSGPQTMPGWAVGITPGGPSDEANQAIDFIVSNNNTALFSTQPAINPAGTLTFTPAANASGNATVTVQIHDNGGTASGGADTSTAQTFVITVTPVNDPPTINAISNLVLNEDAAAQTVSLTGITSGAANESQTLSVTATSSNPALIPNPSVNYTSPNSTGSLNLTPVANASGSSTITLTVNDGGASSASTTITFAVTVNAVNDPPTINRPGDLTINEDDPGQSVPLSGIGSGAANESQTLTVTATSSNPGLIPNPSVSYTSPAATGNLTFAPVANASGNATITVSVNDGGAANNTATVSFLVTVNPVNDPPTLDPISNVGLADGTTSQTVNLTGITSGAPNESQVLVISATSSNPNLIPNPSVNYQSPSTTGSLTLSPVQNTSGSAIITVTVNDGASADNTFSRTFTVSFNALNKPPTISPIGSLTINEEDPAQTVPLSGLSSGAANESQTLIVTATSSNPALIPNPTINYTSPNTTGSLTFKSLANANGSTTITVTVDDGGPVNNTTSTSFTVTVNAVNDAPTIGLISNVTIDEDAAPQTVNFNGISAGPPNESQTLVVTASSSNPALIPNPQISYSSPNAAGTLSFTPAANASGTATITVTVNDGAAANSTATSSFTVTVNPVNDPPTLDQIPAVTINEDAPAQTVTLSGITSGAANETQTLSISAVSGNPSLIPNPVVVYTSPNGTGTLTFTPIANGFGSATITVTVNDGGNVNNTTTRTFTVVVNPVNDSPFISDIANVAVEQDATVPAIPFTIGDVDNSVAELRVIAKSSNQLLVPDANLILGGTSGSRSLAIRLAPGQSGNAIITVQVDDGIVSTSDTFTLIVNKKGTPPTIVTPPISQTIDEGTDVTFKVEATGDPVLTYLWRFQQSPLSGQTSPTLTLRTVQLNQAGSYDVVVTNPNGSTTSNPAILTVRAIELDFGDAPDPSYPTTLKNNGARVQIVKGFSLGKAIDGEKDGQPNANATGDGTDEDGITLNTPLVQGQVTTLHILLSDAAGLPGRLDAWIDFNANGSWADTGEKIFDKQLLNPGDNTLTFAVPSGAKVGSTFARFRLSRNGGTSFDGASSDGGEIEDYQFKIDAPQIVQLDFSDAPDSYATTLKNNGPRHRILQGFFLGAVIDGEADGLPSTGAVGDDATPSTGVDDEDGVVFFGALIPGQTNKVQVTASTTGKLDAWIDFNINGTWADTNERIFAGQTVAGGPNFLFFFVPAGAKLGDTYARFRFSREGGLNFDGLANDGEVEDYSVTISSQQLDFGDAPQLQSDLLAGGYPTTLSRNGARHQILPGFFLGARVDAEPDGQPTADALGDDGSAGALDDEDGVVFLSPLIAGSTATVQVTAAQAGRLDAWFDFNVNLSWADAGDKIFNNQALVPGVNTLNFFVPASAKQGVSFARFRFSRQGGLNFDGAAPDGEVEDYRVTVGGALLDYGDAPSPYPTLIKDDGARHVIDPKFILGRLIDGEPDGLPDSAALGDDGNNTDDEDGVLFLTPLVPDKDAKIEVRVSAAGRLDGWIDFFANGNWTDQVDRIFLATPVAAGVNSLTIHVPAQSKPGPTFARFRLSREGGLNFTGPASVGEVEDYRLNLEKGNNCDLSCAGTDFWVAFPRNYAPDPSNPVKPSICAVGTPGTTVTVDILGLTYTKSVLIPAAGSITIDLPKETDLGKSNDKVENKGVHVTSSSPITIHGLSKVLYTSDGFLGLPTEVLGTEYVIQSYANVYADVPELNGTQFAVVATEDNTTVTIVPSFVTQGHDSGFPYTVKMNRGQSYQLRNTNGAPADLTGTFVSADKPVSVFGSHACANVNSPALFFCDYLVEHLLPVKHWGTDFLTYPLKTRAGGDTFRLLAAYDSTIVSYNGIPFLSLDKGQSFQLSLLFAARLTASHPIHVTQYANSSDYDKVTTSDPFMMQVPHRGLWDLVQRFCAPSGFTAHYANIIAPTATAAAGLVRLDGAVIAPINFTPIAASGFSGASIPVAAGGHSITAPQPIGVTCYGWAKYESYGWPACFFFGDTTAPIVNCPPPKTVDLNTVGAATGNFPCVTPVPDFRQETTFTDNCPRGTAGTFMPEVITQDPPAGTLVGPGEHEVTVSVTDGHGNTGTCATKFIVIGPKNVPTTQPVAHCPNDIVTRCVNDKGAIVTFSPYVTIGCDQVPMECNPPSGSTFPVGITTVTCVYKGVTPNIMCSFNVVVSCTQVAVANTGNAALSMSWETGQTLQVSGTPTGPWTDLPGAESGLLVPATGNGKFYRLRPVYKD